MREFRAFMILLVTGLILLAGLVFLAWRLMAYVSPDGARAWALAATLLIPAALWAGHKLGHTEARGRLQGIDEGLDKVVIAATKAIDLRVQAIRQTREVTQQQPSLIVLPPPEPSFRMLEEPRGQEIVELE